MIKYFKLLFKITAISSFLLLCGAYMVEYLYDVPPCKLCTMQRIPHWFILIISLIGIYWVKLKEIFASLIVLLYLSSAILSIYHVSVENNWFGLHSDCSAYLDTKITEIEQFKAQIMKNEIITCDTNHFKIFQISLAGWNFVLSLVAFIFTAVYVFIFTMVEYDPQTEKITWQFKKRRINRSDY